MNPARVLLVNPAITSRSRARFPLSLMSLAAALSRTSKRNCWMAMSTVTYRARPPPPFATAISSPLALR